MSRRERPYVSKPSDALKERLAAAQSARLFVLQTPGPTSFVLREDGAREKKIRVSIGMVHSCSCGAREQPCVHAAFVLLRIYRLEPNNPICWQTSLIDRELESLVEKRARSMAMSTLRSREWGAAPGGGEPAATGAGGEQGGLALVPRRPLDDSEEADPCPICYEEIGVEDEEAGSLDWCRRSCGKSVHKRCFAMWEDHQKSIGQKLTCPHCRAEWMSEAAAGFCAPCGGGGPSSANSGNANHGQASSQQQQQTSSSSRREGHAATTTGSRRANTGTAARRPIHRDARCRSCRAMPVIGTRYRCLVCPEVVELCGECFNSCMHPHHPFAAREKPSAAWKAAPCRAAERLQEPASPQQPPSRTAAAPDITDALAELQHRDITPEDYDLLMALSQSHGSGGSGDIQLPSQPRSRGLIATRTASAPNAAHRRAAMAAEAASFGGGDGGGGGGIASLVSRLVLYDVDDVMPLVDGLNEIEAEAAERRKAAAEAAKPPSLITGHSVTMAARGASGGGGGDGGMGLSVGGRPVGGGGGSGVAFGSSGSRPWQQHRSAGSAAAERAAANRMAASAGIGFEDMGLSGEPAAGADSLDGLIVGTRMRGSTSRY